MEPHSRNFPSNPDHQGAEEVAREVLNDGEGRGEDGKHEQRNDKAIDAGVHPGPHGEDGLTKDVAASEASACHSCGHI